MDHNADPNADTLPTFNSGDEWEEELPADEDQAMIERRLHDMPNHLDQVLIQIEDDADEEEHEEELRPVVANIIDLTDNVPLQLDAPVLPTRNLPVAPPDICLYQCEHEGILLKPGVTVQIQAQNGLYNASFLYIQSIIQTQGGIELRGLPLTRTKHLRGQLPRLRNEICLVLQVDDDDKRPPEEQAAINLPLSVVVRGRDCHFTNADFPAFRFPPEIYTTNAEIEEKGMLMCRWKYVLTYKDASTRTRKRPPLEYTVKHISYDEVPKERFRVLELHRLNNWRGGKIRGGAFNPSPVQTNGFVVNVDMPDDVAVETAGGWILQEPGQQYTFGDMFCGAGGASLGVRKAGFRVTLGCDNASGACLTYGTVFPEADLRNMDIYQFITDLEIPTCRVDVLHLSPPCQYWSPAHTVASANDEANIAVLFSCHELIKKLRPRVFTLEQTYGILHPKFEHYFNALIHGFTQNSYSVRWKTINLVTWGAPARRQRLVMIGSCPGEELPPFPGPTHSENPVIGDGMKKFVTVRDMLRKIPRDAERYDELHNPSDLPRKQLQPWDPNIYLRRCITTNGGVGNYHFSGKRDFTLREYATLQGFPADYPFQLPARKRQIGNAFPPPVVKRLYAHIRQWLEKRDRVYPVEKEPYDPDDEDVILIDDEDDEINREFVRGEAIVVEDDGDAGDYGGEIEFTGSRRLRIQSSSNTLVGSVSSGDEMDIDMSNDGDSPVSCVDAVQRRDWGLIDLTKD
ncbi:S-adenosyl-L-methionine-dependent methyltransferase [Biscogniauxia marginata]|nr:S-adenosyl-L-methionine-dependent methyltransferase [Biscogniauxia marginata]